MPTEEETVAGVVRRVRLDLTIAVCALLISTLAAGASWWQARVLQSQTAVLEEQLGAQVWPYVSMSRGVNGNTVEIDASNAGLGPAVLGSFSAYVDGVAQSNYFGILHALLGPNLVARIKHGEKLGFTIDGAQRGSVVRPGERGLGFSLTSARFARPLIKQLARVNFRVCYCAIIPGKCWLTESAAAASKPVSGCPEIPNDLLHQATNEEITRRDF